MTQKHKKVGEGTLRIVAQSYKEHLKSVNPWIQCLAPTREHDGATQEPERQ